MSRHHVLAELRTCGSCEWIFRRSENPEGTTCPKCGFASYGAHYVYGPKCYRIAPTQEPWLRRKVAIYTDELWNEIAEANEARPGASLFSTAVHTTDDRDHQ